MLKFVVEACRVEMNERIWDEGEVQKFRCLLDRIHIVSYYFILEATGGSGNCIIIANYNGCDVVHSTTNTIKEE